MSYSILETPILIVEDDRKTSDRLGHLLIPDHPRLRFVRSLEEAKSALAESHYPIILSDTELGSEDGLSLLPFVKTLSEPTVVIYFTTHANVETAVRCLQEGAFDYLPTTSNLETIRQGISLTLDRAVGHLNSRRLRMVTKKPCDLQSKKIIGNSPEIASIFKLIAKAALSEGNALITGESGTGKELVARAIHEHSERSHQPFVVVNCSALAESLLESELFGHIKGSFTGAICNKMGLFQLANRGTIFLDEIGDISPAVQVSLLRTIQEGEVKPVGGTETQKVDVRVIAATHRNLAQRIVEGKFREDLYYRLKVFHLEVPALRNRKEDIALLVEYFLERAAQRAGKGPLSISEECLPILLSYGWPGNIRELENAIELAVTMTNSNQIYPEHLPAEILTNLNSPPQNSFEPIKPLVMPRKTESLEELEKSQITRVLEETGFNKARTAELLGIDRVTLYRKAKKYGISVQKSIDPASLSANS